jgi:FtsP/CotA-like multicopper oxidase with cupredoxin domain
MNGQSPGPLLTVKEGDDLEVFVDNQLAIESTMHWYCSDLIGNLESLPVR